MTDINYIKFDDYPMAHINKIDIDKWEILRSSNNFKEGIYNPTVDVNEMELDQDPKSHTFGYMIRKAPTTGFEPPLPPKKKKKKYWAVKVVSPKKKETLCIITGSECDEHILVTRDKKKAYARRDDLAERLGPIFKDHQWYVVRIKY